MDIIQQLPNQFELNQMFAKLILILILASSLHAQEFISEQLNVGTYREYRRQNKSLPSSYICGAGAWKNRRLISPDSVSNRYIIGNVYLRNVEIGLATNGIRFQFCHFEQWSRQMSIEEKGFDEWTGLKMCPEGQYVYGFRTKDVGRDGITALVLFCRSMKNSNLASEVLVFDGEGGWRSPVISSNFALGFKVRFQGISIVGIAFQMTPPPYIFAYNFEYQFPKDFNPSPIQIERFVVQNYGSTQMRKQIQFSKSKTFKRIWRNEKGLYHGNSQTSSQSYSQSTTSFMFPVITKSRQSYSMTKSSFYQQSQKVGFGISQSFEVGNKHRDIIPIPACTKAVIQQIVFIYELDIPYKLEIAYTNGEATDYERVNGVYRGVTASEAITRITSEKIC